MRSESFTATAGPLLHTHPHTHTHTHGAVCPEDGARVKGRGVNQIKCNKFNKCSAENTFHHMHMTVCVCERERKV